MYILFIATANNPCVPKYYDDPDVPEIGRINCECTATYCDTVDEVPSLAVGEYVLYTSNVEGLRFEKTTSLFESKPIADSEKHIFLNGIVACYRREAITEF